MKELLCAFVGGAVFNLLFLLTTGLPNLVERLLCARRHHKSVNVRYEMDKTTYIVYQWRWCECGRKVQITGAPQEGFIIRGQKVRV